MRELGGAVATGGRRRDGGSRVCGRAGQRAQRSARRRPDPAGSPGAARPATSAAGSPPRGRRSRRQGSAGSAGLLTHRAPSGHPWGPFKPARRCWWGFHPRGSRSAGSRFAGPDFAVSLTAAPCTLHTPRRGTGASTDVSGEHHLPSSRCSAGCPSRSLGQPGARSELPGRVLCHPLRRLAGMRERLGRCLGPRACCRGPGPLRAPVELVHAVAS